VTQTALILRRFKCIPPNVERRRTRRSPLNSTQLGVFRLVCAWLVWWGLPATSQGLLLKFKSSRPFAH
jgi:hypothetical protein